MVKSRKAIPVDIRLAVLHEAGYRCANPTCRFVLTIDLHHIEYVSENGSNAADNLLAMCRNCHGLHHKGEIPSASIRAWKFLLLALNEAFDRRSVDVLLLLADMQIIENISGDGVATFAPLVASGMALMQERGMPKDGHRVVSYMVRLTEKGRTFIEGWKAGNQTQALIAAEPVSEAADG